MPIKFLVVNQREYLILNLSHYILLSSILYFFLQTGVKFDQGPLDVEQKKYMTKTTNFYFIYDLDAWPKVWLRNFTLKNCLFASSNIVKNSDKEKYVYSGYGIAFDRKVEWSFRNDRNFITFDSYSFDNSSSSHTDNRKINFLILGEWGIFGINRNSGGLEKRFSISFNKPNKKCCLSLHYNADNSCLFVNGKKVFKFKADNKSFNFPIQLCLGSISNGFSNTETR